MAAAGGEHPTFRVFAKKIADELDAGFGIGEIIEAELKKSLAGGGLAAGVFEQAGGIGEAEGDTDSRK